MTRPAKKRREKTFRDPCSAKYTHHTLVHWFKVYVPDVGADAVLRSLPPSPFTASDGTTLFAYKATDESLRVGVAQDRQNAAFLVDKAVTAASVATLIDGYVGGVAVH